MKKIVSLILSFAICVTLIPHVYAAESTGMSAGRFVDVPAGAWYYDALEYSTLNGFISGTSETTFSPAEYMSVAQFVTILGRMVSADLTVDTSAVPIENVKSDAYYAPYMIWAVQSGCTEGINIADFSPDNAITREQVAVLIANYIELSNAELEEKPSVKYFADMSSVSDYAVSAVETMRKYGILSGDSNGNVAPQKSLTRCEGIAVMTRFSKLLELGEREPVPVESVSFLPSNTSFYDSYDSYDFFDFFDLLWGDDLQQEYRELDYGSTIKLTAEVKPQNATNPRIFYFSSDDNIATVSQDGTVTGKRGGTVTITAMSANGCKAEMRVDVNGPTIIFDAAAATSRDLVSAAMELIPDGDTEYRIRMIHDLIVNTLTYDPRVSSIEPISAAEKAEIDALYTAARKKFTNSNDIALYTGYGVCDDYANLFNAMCAKAGIQCRKIVGYATGSHAWNQVFVDGTWYNIDCTWDDPVTPYRTPVLRYDYYMISMEEMADDHYWSGYGYPYTMKYDPSWNSIDITNITSKVDWYKGFIAQLAQKKTTFTMTAASPNVSLGGAIAYSYSGWTRIVPERNGNSYTYTVTYR